MRTIALILIFTLATYCLFANGWQTTTKYYSIPANSESERIEDIYLLNGYMKMVNGDLTTIFDLIKNEIIYINTLNRTYWKGNPKRFLTEIRAELEASIEEKIAKVDKEKQEEQRAMYKEMIEASFPSKNAAQGPTKSFFVRKDVDGEKISGFNTSKYSIIEDSMPLETVWIASELTISKDFDFFSLSQFLNQLAQGAYANSFESSPEYFKLLEKGYPVKVEIRRGDGSTEISEVTSAKRIKLNPSDFAVPSNYKPASLTHVGVWDGYY
jgi:hypothetical protein